MESVTLLFMLCCVISVSRAAVLKREEIIKEITHILDDDTLKKLDDVLNQKYHPVEKDHDVKKVKDHNDEKDHDVKDDALKKLDDDLNQKYHTDEKDHDNKDEKVPDEKDLDAKDHEVKDDKDRNDEAIKCEDDPSHKDICSPWKKAGACETHKDIMRTYCRKTCNDCKAPLPPVPDVPRCSKTQYGCCWDNTTVALGPTNDITQSQCRPCLNKRSDVFCNRWKSDCGSSIIGQGDFMKNHCPITCGVPCDYNMNINKCRDDPANALNCIAWYGDGKCFTEETKMRVLCPSMCGFCTNGELKKN